MHEAKVAPTNALTETSIKSFVRSGAIAPMPEIKIPTLEKLAKPHKAYSNITFVLSVKNSGSNSPSWMYATNSFVANLSPNNSAADGASDHGMPNNQHIGANI